MVGLVARALALAGALLLTGCVTTGTQKIQALPSGQRLAVVSALGDELEVKYVGTLVFENETRRLDVADWQLDRWIETTIEQRLGSTGRFVLVPCEPDRAQVAKILDRPTGAFSDDRPELLTLARATCEADLYLLAYPYDGEIVYGMPGGNVRGYGLYRRSFLGMTGSALIYAGLHLKLFPATGQEEIGKTLLRALDGTENAYYPMQGDLTEAASAGAKRAMEALLEQHLAERLREMKLL